MLYARSSCCLPCTRRQSARLRCRSLTAEVGQTILTVPEALVITLASNSRAKRKVPYAQPATALSAARSLAALAKLAATVEEVPCITTWHCGSIAGLHSCSCVSALSEHRAAGS